MVIALIVTPEGFLHWAMKCCRATRWTTRRCDPALEGIEQQYGKARRVWVMDRGIPTEETLAHMRQSDPPLSYLVGTPKGRLSQLEAQPGKNGHWQKVREGITVKLLPQPGNATVFAQRALRASTKSGRCDGGNSNTCGSGCRNCAR